MPSCLLSTLDGWRGWAILRVQSMTKALGAEPNMPACYYAGNPNMDGCLQCSSVDIVMVNKSATPKSRRACEVCSDWLLDKRLAKVEPTCVVVSIPDVVLVLASFSHRCWFCSAS